MSTKKQGIFFWITRIMVFLLYVPFLLIHGLFNYPNSFSGNDKNVAYSYIVKSAGDKNAVVKTGDAAKKANFKIRLNKRFQPESYPFLCSNDVPGVTVYFTTSQSYFSYTPPFPASFILGTHKLRGPPEIV